MAAGHVWLSHVGLTALHYRDEPEPGLPRGMYVGYRYFVQRGHVATRRHGEMCAQSLRPIVLGVALGVPGVAEPSIACSGG